MELGDLTAGALELGIFELLRQRLVKAVPVAQPAAGADWSASVPAGAAWELLHVKATLTTGAAVANRGPVVRVQDNSGNDFDAYPAAAVQAASLAAEFGWEAGYGAAVTAILNVASMSEPPPLAPQGGLVKVVTANLQAADQWSGILLTVREWSIVSVSQAAEWFSRKQWPA